MLLFHRYCRVSKAQILTYERDKVEGLASISRMLSTFFTSNPILSVVVLGRNCLVLPQLLEQLDSSPLPNLCVSNQEDSPMPVHTHSGFIGHT